MSLTSHIDDPTSRVRKYLASTFPQTRALRLTAAEATSTATGDVKLAGLWLPDRRPFPSAVVLPDGDGYPWGTAGTAFDYRLRYLYQTANPDTFTAAHGAHMLGMRTRRAGGSRLWRQLIAALPPAAAGIRPSDDADRVLAQLCVALAWFEELYRMGPRWRRHPLVTTGPDATLPELLNRVDDRVVKDAVAMTRLFVEQHPELLGAAEVVLNPTFGRSADLGGADADLILDRLLLEVKASKAVTLRSAVVWQLVGYLLADTDDVLGIDRVGLYFARHGLLWTFPVSWFLARLAGHEVDLAVVRADFARACAPSRRQPSALIETPARRRRLGPVVRPDAGS